MKQRSKTTTRKIHSMMATYMLVAIGAAGILSVPGVSAADSCTDDGYDMACSFTCQEGETMFVSGNGDPDGHGWVRAECEGALSRCTINDQGFCHNRGTSTADDSGTGQCLGNSGGGRGNMYCGSGSGSPDLLGILDGLLEVGAPCPTFATHLKGSAISSLTVMNRFDSEGSSRMFTWNADTGCQ